MKKIKLGVVGLNRGNVHAINSLKCSNTELVAVCDTDCEKADARASEYRKISPDSNIKVYYDYHKLLEDPEIDAVVMATPIDVHTQTVTDALNAGKHVLSEVIVATAIEDIYKIGEAIKKSGKIYMMAENYCFIRPLLIIEELIRSGRLGEIYYAESDYLKDFQEYNPNFPNIGGWRQKTYFGRRGHPYITHTLGPLLHIMKEKVVNVSCMASGHSFDMVADNTCTLMLQTDKGHLIRLRSSFVSPRPDNVTYYSFQGTNGCYQAPQGSKDFHKVYIKGIGEHNKWSNIYEFKEYCSDEWKKYWNPNDYMENMLDNDTYELYDSGTVMMLEKFASCILNGDAVPVSFSDAANWTAAGILSEESVNNNVKSVDVPQF